MERTSGVHANGDVLDAVVHDETEAFAHYQCALLIRPRQLSRVARHTMASVEEEGPNKQQQQQLD